MNTPHIIFRPSVTKEMQDLLPTMVTNCTAWMKNYYPDVNFTNIAWEAVGGKVKSRYFHNEKRILICHSGSLCFYARACREIQGLKEEVGTYHPALVTPPIIVHELTHHVQYERNFHKGNETDTALNELCWLREHMPQIFHRCWTGKPKDVSPARIRHKRTHPIAEPCDAGQPGKTEVS